MTTSDKPPDHTSWPPGLHSHPTTSQSDLSKPQNTSYHSPTLNPLKGLPVAQQVKNLLAMQETKEM